MHVKFVGSENDQETQEWGTGHCSKFVRCEKNVNKGRKGLGPRHRFSKNTLPHYEVSRNSS